MSDYSRFSNGVMVYGRASNVFLYNPHFWVSTTGYKFNLPWPLMQTSEEYIVDVKTAKIPLVDGVSVIDVSRGALSMSFSGIIVADTHAEVLEIKRHLNTWLIDTPNTFWFYRYYASTPDGTYARYYKGCYCTSLTFAATTRTVNHLPYTLTILNPEAKEYVSGTYTSNIDEGAVAGYGDGDTNEDDIIIPGPLIVALDNNAGSDAVIIEDSTGQIVAKCTAGGDILYTGISEQVDTITL